MRTTFIITALLALCLPLAACGTASEPTAAPTRVESPTPSAVAETPSPSAPAQTTALKAAVRAYSEACLSGNAKAAYLLLSKKGQKRISYAEYKYAVGQIKDIYGEAEMTSLKVVKLSGSKALVTYRYDISEIDQVKEPWVLEKGQWRCNQ